MSTNTSEVGVGVGAEVEQAVMEAAALSGPTTPQRILVAPWGEVTSVVGSFVVDDESVRETIAAFERHGTDLPIDYEHQTLGGEFSSPTGQAPAAGWIRALSAVSPEDAAVEGASPEPGLWAEVAWTAEAETQLRDRKYRYLSPVALIRRSDRRLVGLHSVALTNKPAIVGMRPLVNRAGEPASAEACEPLALSELRRTLGLESTAGGENVLAAATERITSLEQQEASRQASERVQRAMIAGKLTAGQREWALSLAERLPDEFDAWERGAPIVVPLGRTVSPQRSTLNARQNRSSVETVARAEWRANRSILEGLCTEAAYVADAVRQASIEN